MIDRQSFWVSAGIHVFCIFLLLFKLPSFEKNLPPTKVIAVSLVPIDRLTQSPQKIHKKVPRLSDYKKPTYKMGKTIVRPEPIIEKTVPQKPTPKETNNSFKEKIISLKASLKPISKPPLKKDPPMEEKIIHPPAVEQPVKKAKDPFDSVLQSVQEFEPDTAKDHKTTDPRAFEADLISSKISISELDALRQQLQRCWLVPPTVMAEKNLVVEAAVDLDVRGMVTHIKIINQREGEKFRSFREAVQSVRQALHAPECCPLKLPADKYHQWKKCVLRFSSKGIG